MSVFSTNQFRHLYVAKALDSSVDTLGDIAVAGDNGGSGAAKTHMYFKYFGKGGVLRSDLIDVKNIIYAKATPASALARKTKVVAIEMDSAVNSGAPVANQDYVVRINYSQYLGISDEDTYFEMGTAHAVTSESASKLLADLAVSLSANTAKQGLVEIHLATTSSSTLTDAGKVEVYVKDGVLKGKINGSDINPSTTTYTGILIKEIEQPWIRGIKESTPVNFTVSCPAIYASGSEVFWAKVTDKSEALGSSIGDGEKIADLEYFCMGERGDIYRNVGWPNVIPTEYMVDPTKEYSVIDIHYYYQGSNEAVQKSEKDLTIVVPNGDSGSEYSTIDDIIGAINTMAGLSIATLTPPDVDD